METLPRNNLNGNFDKYWQNGDRYSRYSKFNEPTFAAYGNNRYNRYNTTDHPMKDRMFGKNMNSKVNSKVNRRVGVDRYNSELEDDVFANDSRKAVVNERYTFDSRGNQNTNNTSTSPIKDMYTSMMGNGRIDTIVEEKATGRNSNLVGSVQEELEMLRVSFSGELSEDEGSRNVGKFDLIDDDDDDSDIRDRSPRRKSFKTQEYQQTERKTKSVSLENKTSKEHFRQKSMSSSANAGKRLKPLITPPHVDTSTGLARFVASVDLSEFMLSLTDVQVFLDPIRDRRLVVEAVQRGVKDIGSKSLTKHINLPRFADIFEIKHRINVMGVLKIEIPLLYYSEEVSRMRKEQETRTNAYVYNANRNSNLANVASNRSSELPSGNNGNGLEIVVKPGDGCSVDNIRVKIQDNIIIISELIPRKSFKKDAVNTRVINDDHNHNHHEDDYDDEDINGEERFREGYRDENKQNNFTNKPQNKLRFIRLYRLPSSAIKEDIRCERVEGDNLSISIPMKSF